MSSDPNETEPLLIQQDNEIHLAEYRTVIIIKKTIF
jgi:hypothetical protein